MEVENPLEHFSLRWNNFNDNLKSGFHDLLRTEDFVDVTIAAEGKLIQAHKMVLSVCSPYFKNIFKTNPCQHPVVFLKDVTPKELTGILQFMYLGEVSIQQEELASFLKTAEALQIKGLTGDRRDSKSQVLNEVIGESHQYQGRNKTKLINTDLLNKETCSKKMKLSSKNDLVKNSNQQLVQNQTETVNIVNKSQDLNIFPKTEPIDEELSEVESDVISIKEDLSANESFVQYQNDNVDVKVDFDHTSLDPGSSNLSQEVLSGIQGMYNEFVMAESNQVSDLRCFPLTKNQGLCPICGRILQHKKNLQTHIADQHSGIFRSWACQLCHKVCKTWSALRVHTNRHHSKSDHLVHLTFSSN